MLDVHPPAHTPHSWRDFFIHIATIVVGLIIAVGLEQAVEAAHHHHQRKHLLESLRDDAAGATQDANTAVAGMSFEIAYDEAVLAWIGEIRQKQGQKTSNPARRQSAFGTPDDFSWRSAQSSGLLALLSPEENRAFEMNDWKIRKYETYIDERNIAHRDLSSLWHSFDDASGEVDLSHASPEELARLSGLVSTDRSTLQSAQTQLRQISALNSEIAKGHFQEAQLVQAMNQARR